MPIQVIALHKSCLMFQSAALQLTEKAQHMINNHHYSSEIIRSIGENVTTRWQQLMCHATDRIKLVVSARNWFKTAEQVEMNVFLSSPGCVLCLAKCDSLDVFELYEGVFVCRCVLFAWICLCVMHVLVSLYTCLFKHTCKYVLGQCVFTWTCSRLTHVHLDVYWARVCLFGYVLS